MFKNLAYSDIYLRFLNLTRAIRELPDFPDMDPVEGKGWRDSSQSCQHCDIKTVAIALA